MSNFFNNLKNDNGLKVGIAIVVILVFMLISSFLDDDDNKYSYTDNTFNIIASSDVKVFDKYIKDYCNKQGYNVDIVYDDSLKIMSRLNNGESFDAVWLSNSIWMYMIDSSKVSINSSKSTSINPIVFGIKKSKAKELGFVGKDVYSKDIVNAIKSGKLKFSMSNPTTTNSGASAYLGILTTIAGNPEVLTMNMIKDEKLKNEMKSFFTGMERSSGDEDFLEELFLKGDYEAVFSYESSIININKELEKKKKETLYAVYPVDGVSISDSPFAYIDNKDDNKKVIFDDIQKFLLSAKSQKVMAKYGRRTWYGGKNNNTDKKVFNPDWGIDTNSYISPIKYPSTEVIKEALLLYQTSFRKPVHVAFCLDYSGSMYGEGNSELVDAMDYILTDRAAQDLIQFSNEDKIDVLPFATEVGEGWSTSKGLSLENILDEVKKHEVNGTTALFPCAAEALDHLKNTDKNKYNLSVVLMTDGAANVGYFKDLSDKYSDYRGIPIYSIMFGSAAEYQLTEVSNLSNGKIFDGKKDLVGAFREVRGYN